MSKVVTIPQTVSIHIPFQIIKRGQNFFDDVAFHAGIHHLIVAFNAFSIILEFSLRPCPAIFIFDGFGFSFLQLIDQRLTLRRRLIAINGHFFRCGLSLIDLFLFIFRF